VETCTAAVINQTRNERILALFAALREYIESVQQVIPPICGLLDQFLNDSQATRRSHATVIEAAFSTVHKQLSNVIATVGNREGSGLLNKMNCAFLGYGVKHIMNGFCFEFSEIFATSKLLGIIGLSSMFVCLALYGLFTKVWRIHYGPARIPLSRNEDSSDALPSRSISS
jgi:hypothetical protein